MARIKRFQLVYRKNGILQQDEVEAYDFEQAVAVGRKWCSLEMERRFVNIKNAVLAGPEILDEKVKREAPGVTNFEELSVRAAMAVVQNGDIEPEEAMEREKAGQNRKSLIAWLGSKVTNPETQGVPF